MAFNPANPIVQLCMQAMSLEEQDNHDAAHKLYEQAWQETTDDFEKFIASYYLARHEKNNAERLNWFETCLQFALRVNDNATNSALPSIYNNISQCYASMGDQVKAHAYAEQSKQAMNISSDKGPFYHGTRADLKTGDLLTAGGNSNYTADLIMNHIYFTALLNGAGLAASLAKGDGKERVYIIEPTGPFENDPNVTDKKFPGNPTRSYRSIHPLKIIGEALEWHKISEEEIKQWREKLANNKGQIIN